MAWVERVAAERARLGRDQMDRVVHRMTEQEPARQCTIHEAVEALASDSLAVGRL